VRFITMKGSSGKRPRHQPQRTKLAPVDAATVEAPQQRSKKKAKISSEFTRSLAPKASPPQPDLPPSSYSFHFPAADTGVSAQKTFRWLLAPLSINCFFADHFEKTPVLLRAQADHSDRFTSFLSEADVRRLVADSGSLSYGADVDVTRYARATGRETLNGAYGTPVRGQAWKEYTDSGCSIRLLRPQKHVDSIWALCATLETFFGTVVGANAYLTPPDSQGFAPHFDDIDAFVCQVSGKKRWRVYKPREDGCDNLPRASSVDFTHEEMEGVEPIIDAVLGPGDMLYMPRGAVHQAECYAAEGKQYGKKERDEAEGSLHVTISACQKWTWADFLMETFSSAVRSAAAERVGLRRTLPLRFGDYVGVGNANVDPTRRDNLDRSMRKALKLVADVYPIDAAGDSMAERFMQERLPMWVPGSSAEETGEMTIETKSWVRLKARAIARVVMDGDGDLPVLVHCMGNGREAKLKSPAVGRMSCTPQEALAIDTVIKAYPSFVRVGDLPLDSVGDRVTLAECLLEMNIATVK
jgi:bifunctional lysine-specific demethylase and histidyl-hydroxylase NO66